MRLQFGIGVLVVAGAWLPAQQPRPAAGDTAEPTLQSPQEETQDYSEPKSRQWFTACDGDSDDRLDLFEACEALETLDDPKDTEAFRRLDADRDGYLSWPEFDRHFQFVIERGNTFRVQTCRRLSVQAPEPQPASPVDPLQQFLQLHDANRNGALDPAEIEQFVRQANLPPLVGSQMKALDRNQSGRLEATELAPGLELMRAFLPSAGVEPNRAVDALPAPWSAADRNGDGRIDAGELANLLRRFDPSLARWAAELLRALDRNKDGSLGANELPAGASPSRAAQTSSAAGAPDHRRAATAAASAHWPIGGHRR